MRHLIAVVACVVASACAYHNPAAPTSTVPPPSTAPASIRLGASSQPGGASYIVTATVLTADGHFVPNVVVDFALDGGTVDPASATTGADGVAQAVAAPSTAAPGRLTVSGASLSASLTLDGSPTVVRPQTVAILVTPGLAGAATAFNLATETVVSAVWNFGDGSAPFTTALPTAAHVYSRAGNYTASVAVTDRSGRTATASRDFSVTAPAGPPPPVVPTLGASLTCVPSAHGTPTPCNLAATWGGAPVDSSAITHVVWDFGDGQDQTIDGAGAALASHVFAQAGTYLIVANVSATAGGGTPATTTSKLVIIP
jgi:hypothetical protein